MTGIQYQNLAIRTARTDLSINGQLINVSLGLCGESGEFADLLKKSQFQGHKLDCEHMRKELGDILWYIALGAHTLGTTIDELMETNIEKLKARYPEGFAVANSIDRKEGDI